jgi:hypothetical protein
MSRENPLWGAPCIHGKFLKPGIDVGQPGAARYPDTWSGLQSSLSELVHLEMVRVVEFVERSHSPHTGQSRSGRPGGKKKSIKKVLDPRLSGVY